MAIKQRSAKKYFHARGQQVASMGVDPREVHRRLKRLEMPGWVKGYYLLGYYAQYGSNN